MYEHRSKPLLPRRKFLQRVAKSVLAGIGMIVVSLVAGMLGYHFLDGMSWLDAYANAAMILSGMGPLATPVNAGAKFFAGTYALYSGLFVIFVAGVMFAPLLHRFLHRFHLEQAEREAADDNREAAGPAQPAAAGRGKGRRNAAARGQAKPR